MQQASGGSSEPSREGVHQYADAAKARQPEALSAPPRDDCYGRCYKGCIDSVNAVIIILIASQITESGAPRHETEPVSRMQYRGQHGILHTVIISKEENLRE